MSASGKLLVTLENGIKRITFNRPDRRNAVDAVNQADCFSSHDFREGVSAFIEKRKANFVGK